MTSQSLIGIHTHPHAATAWLDRYQKQSPHFACILGFTETALIPGISAAGATPDDRRWTAIADAEYLVNGPQPHPQHPLPPLTAGVSPALITRALMQRLNWPMSLLNAGLAQSPTVAMVDLQGQPAACLSTGQALPRSVVEALFHRGWDWGMQLSSQLGNRYLILSECVVGGTTTALGVLTGLGVTAAGRVNSSHPHCNHLQKQQLVETGLAAAGLLKTPNPDPFAVLAAVGDPMQPVAAGLALAASQRCGVLLAGGTQMLAVYALAAAIATAESLDWHPEQIIVGTTRWVAEDATGDTVGLVTAITQALALPFLPPLIAANLDFSTARYPQLQSYEQGFVKEGVGAGGAAIAACLQTGWHQQELLPIIESELELLIQSRADQSRC